MLRNLKSPGAWSAILIAVGILVRSFFFVFYDETLHVFILPEASYYGKPIRLEIPSIDVDTTLDSVGLLAQGELDTPKDPARGAWYAEGPRPGETGNAVIDGHYGWKDNIQAVFDNLHSVRPGDTVSVFDEKGTAVTFVVRELKTYGEHDNAEKIFVSNDGKSHLVLITCGGAWDKVGQSYSERLVVFADRS